MTPTGWTVREVLAGRPARILFVAAIALRLVYGAWAVLPYRDGVIYDEIAHNLLAHAEFRSSEQMRPPGYPFFLAAIYGVFGEKHLPVRLAQAGLDAIAAILALAIAQRLGIPRRAAVATLAIALFNPSTFLYSAMILSESLAAVLVTAGTLLLVELLARGGRGWMAAGFGAGLSAAALVRPAFALLPAFVLLVALAGRQLAWRPALRVAIVAGAGFLIVWLPWGVRNAVHFGAFVPYYRFHSENVGYHRWVTTWALHLRDEYAAYLDHSFAPPARAWRSEAERAELEPRVIGDRFNALDDRFAGIAAARIAAEPVRYYVVYPLVRCATMWLTPPAALLAQANVPWEQLMQQVGARPVAVLSKTVLAVVTLAFPALALLGWWQVRRRQGRRADIPVAVAVYSTVLVQAVMVFQPHLIVLMEPRYLVGSFPGLAPLVAAGVMALVPAAAARRTMPAVAGDPARGRRHDAVSS